MPGNTAQIPSLSQRPRIVMYIALGDDTEDDESSVSLGVTFTLSSSPKHSSF